MKELHQGVFSGVDKSGGAVTENHRGLFDDQLAPIGELHNEGMEGLPLQVFPQARLKCVFGHEGYSGNKGDGMDP
ncbi:MAG: hypothetical protein FJ271_13400 [Planctomycetes bacterium]|nr:hypothetical protein [Planctomycetota bacterium]